MALGALVAVAAGLLSACGGSSSSTTTTGASTTGSGSGSATAKLDDLTATVKAAEKAKFEAVYTSTSGGSTSTITLAQSPPKQLFSSTDASGTATSLVNTGTATYTCRAESGASTTCTSIGTGATSKALGALIDVYNGSAALAVMKGWRSTLAARVAGASLTFTDETIAGQASTCAHWSFQGTTATYCVTDKGVLAKVETSGGSSGGSSFELTRYTSSPPASDFALPKGATVVTLPGGAGAP